MSEETEIAFVEELRKHENQWVAIHESGETETILFKVLPMDKAYIPGSRNPAY